MWAVWARSVTWFLLEILDRGIEKRRKRKEGRRRITFLILSLFLNLLSRNRTYTIQAMTKWRIGKQDWLPLDRIFSRRSGGGAGDDEQNDEENCFNRLSPQSLFILQALPFRDQNLDETLSFIFAKYHESKFEECIEILFQSKKERAGKEGREVMPFEIWNRGFWGEGVRLGFSKKVWCLMKRWWGKENKHQQRS